MRTASSRRAVIGVRVALVVGVLLTYEVLTRTEVLDPFSWVPLSTAFGTMKDLLTNGKWLPNTVAPTAYSVLASLGIGAATGFVAGSILWRFPRGYVTLSPYLSVYYSIPAFAFYPIFLSLFGAGRISVVLLAALLGFAAMTANVAMGLRSTAPIHVKVGQTLGLTGRQMFTRIYLPAAVPQILVGVRLAVAYSVIGVVGAEYIAGTSGLGYYITYSYDSYKLADMYADILFVVLITMALNGILQLLSKRTYAMETIGT